MCNYPSCLRLWETHEWVREMRGQKGEAKDQRWNGDWFWTIAALMTVDGRTLQDICVDITWTKPDRSSSGFYWAILCFILLKISDDWFVEGKEQDEKVVGYFSRCCGRYYPGPDTSPFVSCCHIFFFFTIQFCPICSFLWLLGVGSSEMYLYII